MKAEQRKRLEKNELAERLHRWWQGDDSGKTSSALWLSIAVGVLVLLLIIAWRYYREVSAKNRSAAWKQLELASSVSDLEAIMEAQRGTVVGRAAKVQLARLLLNEGLNQLASDLQRSRAIENVERARDLYRELSEEARDDGTIRREALLSAAKAEETLLAVPKADKTEGVRGSLDQAIEWYEKAASEYPETPEGRAAADRLKKLREHREDVQRFYTELARRFRTSDVPSKSDAGATGTTGGVGTGISPPPLPPLNSEPPPKPEKPATPLESKTPLAPPPSVKEEPKSSKPTGGQEERKPESPASPAGPQRSMADALKNEAQPSGADAAKPAPPKP